MEITLVLEKKIKMWKVMDRHQLMRKAH